MTSIKLLAALLIGTALTSATFAAPALASRQSDLATIQATQILQQQQLQQQAYLYGQVPTVTVGTPYYNGYGYGVPAQTVNPYYNGYGYGVPAQTVYPYGVPAQTVGRWGWGRGEHFYHHHR